MDKRTILFVLLVGAVFFGFNLYFSNQRDAQNRIALKEHEERKAKAATLLQSELEKRTAKLQDLPITPLNKTSQETSIEAYGIRQTGSTLTLAWTDPLPSTMYIQGQKQTLATLQSVKDGPVLYTADTFENLEIASLPEIGSFDLQLVTFPVGKEPLVTLAEYRDGNVHLLGAPISENAIALYKTTSGWMPLGFYEWQGGVFVELQNLPILSGLTKEPQAFKPTEEVTGQKYFVLENAYQQLVFTNVGGSLVEINLPFESEQNTSSVVKEIGFDREIAKDYPANAHFPAHPYFTPNSKEEQPPGPIGGYYPLLRRGIWNKKIIEPTPQEYALNIVSDYPEMAKLMFSVKEFSSDKIVFEAIQPHRKITKTYTLAESGGAPYIFDLTIQIEGDSRNLWLTSGVPEVEIMSNSSSPQVQYRLSRKGKSEVEKLDLPKPKEVVTVSSIYPDWVVNSNGYLGMILDPLTEMGSGYRARGLTGAVAPTRLSVINPDSPPFPTSKYPGYQIQLPLPSKAGQTHMRIYAGPFEEGVLKKVDNTFTDKETGYNPDYRASWTFYGWFSFISEPFAKLLFIVMKFFYNMTGSWGFSIILLTVFLRVLLYPLNAWSIKSMRRMQQLSPSIQAIQQKYKKDPKKSQMEIMALYKEKKVNPFTGCIPVLIQIPFLMAMFDLLKSSFQLRGASFIPGWIDNLTAPDVIFQWNTPIFFIGNQLHLLPILLGAVMFIQQRISSPTPKDPSKMTDQQRQQKAMGTIMTIVFTVMFYHFPSGLNLYWLSSMLLGILQQWITNKVLDKQHPEEIPPSSQKKLETKKTVSR